MFKLLLTISEYILTVGILVVSILTWWDILPAAALPWTVVLGIGGFMIGLIFSPKETNHNQ